MSQSYEIHDLDGEVRFSLPRSIHGEFFCGRYLFNEEKRAYEVLDAHDVEEVRKGSYEKFEAELIAFWNDPRSRTVKSAEVDEWLKLTCHNIWDFMQIAGALEVKSDHEPWPEERYDWPDIDGDAE